VTLLALASLLPVTAVGRRAAAAPVDFSRDIQPLLARRCLSCHGPDTQEGGLRLDEAAAATGELASGARAIVPGDVAASLILERIVSEDPDVRMPPEGARLTPAQVGALRDWIGAGAEWKEHWAFRAPGRPPVPAIDPAAVPDDGVPATAIDAFVLEGLAKKGLAAPTLADKQTLLRRATYDLTGLPPTEADMEAFLADDAPGAWERVVDRLLASPHYGEKWGRHWLDLVRYAETNSFERDGDKPHAWRYRDYVIRAFNNDTPFDRFTVQQLAGDEIPDPSPDDLIATGYHRLGLWDDEPADRLQARFDWLDDLVATTGQTFLGLTVNCARCHDHKIDPIPQRDYYGLLSFFMNVTPMGNGGDQVERPLFSDAASKAAYEAAVADLARRRDAAQAEVTALENRFREEYENRSADGVAASDLDDLHFRFYRDTWEKLPDFDQLKAEDTGDVAGNLLDIGVAPSLRPHAFGYVFTGFLKVPAAAEYTFSLDSDDGSRLVLGGSTVLEYDGIHGVGSPRTATVKLEAGRIPFRVDYFQGPIGDKGLLLSWRPVGGESRPLSALPKPRGRKAATELAAAIKAEGSAILGAEGFQAWEKATAALEALKREQVPVAKALVVTEHGPVAPETFVLYRGNPHAETKPENKVEPSFPRILRAPAPEIAPPAADAKSSGRRTSLATWIASPQNPLTARVLANRVWQYHFGRGIVRSASNFGLMGDPPTHPELLDWLAAELVDGGWRLKSLHRTIMLSRAYRASSAANSEALAVDPLNDAFWRFDMRRLTAEEIRDSIHVASGAFNPKMGGPGVTVDIPKEILAGQSQPGSGWGKVSEEEQARRSVYIKVKRSLLTPILADFDMADTDSACPVRFVTTQPTQALGMMNGEFLQKQAKVMATRVKREAGGRDAADIAAEIRRAYRVALVRDASPDEVTRGVALIDTLEDADGVGPGRALELFCLMLLNTNEFAYLD
jgi:mono/diheme cytochrome c family protein